LLTWSAGGDEDDSDVDVGPCVFCLHFSFCFPCLSEFLPLFPFPPEFYVFGLSLAVSPPAFCEIVLTDSGSFFVCRDEGNGRANSSLCCSSTFLSFSSLYICFFYSVFAPLFRSFSPCFFRSISSLFLLWSSPGMLRFWCRFCWRWSSGAAVWKICWGWCSCGVKVKTMTMVMEGCPIAAASSSVSLFLFFCFFVLSVSWASSSSVSLFVCSFFVPVFFSFSAVRGFFFFFFFFPLLCSAFYRARELAKTSPCYSPAFTGLLVNPRAGSWAKDVVHDRIELLQFSLLNRLSPREMKGIMNSYSKRRRLCASEWLFFTLVPELLKFIN